VVNADAERAALATLLACGPWPDGVRASALVSSQSPPGLPPDARRALYALVGTTNPTARDLGNALRRIQDQRVQGIPLTVKRTLDGHGYAIWQVVHIGGDTSNTAARPRPGELLHSTLTRLGYRPAEAQHAVAALSTRVETDSLEDLLRAALRVLGQRAMPDRKRG